ncbi:CocE/NonD family hydrolase [Streptomyces pratensis]|uniref:CocE/NonD family hydrolase n=1 Tax=Streptomyces pratensis TaxID=1169025 RepID=UPI003017B64E
MTTVTAYVPASGGAELATDVCLPEGAGPHPAVVIRTPYGRTAHRAELRGWAARGFAALAQDVRGRHGSPGEWRPYRDHEASDGAATVSWTRARPWSDGRVVAAGASYAAHCALVTALADDDEGRPDAVIAAVPALGLADTAREPTGPERLWARAGWWAAHGDRPDSDQGALESALAADPRLLERLPVTGLGARLGEELGRELPSWPQLWSDRRRGRVVERGATARLPLLAVGGTRDPFAEDTMALWRGWGGPARLLLGPWGHRLTAETPGRGRVDLGALYVRWARAALAGRLEPTRRGVIALGDSGRWHSAPEPEPHGIPEPERHAGRAWEFGAPHGLRLLHGQRFTADPGRPVRSDDLAVPRDDAPADRCLLLSPPLPRPLDMAGPAAARINVAADTPGADWAVRLTALDPAGRAEPLAFGIVRRADPLGKTVGITVPLGTLGRRLAAGTRLRAEIAGHHFPTHARNPHTGEDPVTAIRLAPSRRSVTARGSALLLPVIARRRYVEPEVEICR